MNQKLEVPEKISIVIMAGGKGERFWPRSRVSRPKQYSDLTGEGSLLYLTYNRALQLAPAERIFVVTGAEYRELTCECLPQLPQENIIIEPEGRNTAPCIGLAAITLEYRLPGTIMAVLPSDHLIRDEEQFARTLALAASTADETGGLVAIGIRPDRPETGYGYLRVGQPISKEKAKTVYRVDKFVEKPDLIKAREYLEDGGYLWNAGIFVWKAAAVLEEFKTHLPGIYEGLQEISRYFGSEQYNEVLQRTYPCFDRISIDYGIMEKAVQVYIVPGEFYWDDVGTWMSLERVFRTDENGNVFRGKVTALNTENSIIDSNGRMVALIGVKDLVIVETDDVTFVCNKNETDRLRELLEELRRLNMEEYL
ncbi:mannose-1-phosphate guanylyltransferase [Phosphitispora sp. TUW77]|uniref:mannose-1-phosphate guanylyltransferase n=1 Tax=Phosphitispora sp. TUW77 TaxID=3152361 RepID=UPI003AB5E0C0